MRATLVPLLTAISMAACAHRGPLVPVAAAPAAIAPARIEVPCWTCTSIPMTDDMARAVERRIADLKAQDGDCKAYGVVIENSWKNGLVTLRPSMWRVGTRLAAGEAKPSGEMAVALEIDSLNAGVRAVDEVLGSLEHEAVHITFSIPSTSPENEARVEDRVRACRPKSATLPLR